MSVRPSVITLKIRSGLGKTARDRVVGSGFRAPDGLGMTFAGTVKLGTPRFFHEIVSESLLKQHHGSQFSEIDRLVRLDLKSFWMG